MCLELVLSTFIDQRTAAPATSAVPYEVKSIDVYEPSNFTGEPRHELDVAWSNLLRSTKIRVSEDEMRTMNKTSVSLRDGTGYLGYPEVLHQLHCVKRVYQFRHQDYYTDLDPDTFGIHHWDHCIEVLRRGIMCNADLTIDTFKWHDGEIKGISSHPRTCKNWKAFEEWSDARALHFNGKEPSGTLVMENEEGAYGPLDLE
ncbi:hypothetical protein PRZ48_002750 [Zasmidium cellare]|uniref:Uncharacterized protein n=1 Tax=Zasmidium cellare TaxID=395010 RepID=A0ABR0EVC2_ZASCE|nr:hypothetical protein PRZ48_002750 [Zasmidium cellare]